MVKTSILPIYVMLALLAGIMSCSAFSHLDRLTVFAQGEENSSSSSNAGGNGNGNTTNSVPDGSIELTNLDIPSMDITLPDGSSISPDFRSIYFKSGGNGDSIYAYYNDYAIPEVKPQLKASDKFNIDSYPLNANTPKPSAIQVSISKIISGDETGNFTAMKLDKPISGTFKGNQWSFPNSEPGNYIMNIFVSYPFGGIVQVYTIEVQIAA